MSLSFRFGALLIGALIGTLFFLLAALPLWAAMSDSKAMETATELWGPIARIAHIRGPFSTYWTQQVGVDSSGCAESFTILGSAPNTWDAAFSAVDPDAIAGPYSGQLTLQALAWDNLGVVGLRFRLDGSPIEQEVVRTMAPYWDVAIPWNSSSVADGVHVLCVTAQDSEGLIGRSMPVIFRTDQREESISNVLAIKSHGKPGVSYAR